MERNDRMVTTERRGGSDPHNPAKPSEDLAPTETITTGSRHGRVAAQTKDDHRPDKPKPPKKPKK